MLIWTCLWCSIYLQKKKKISTIALHVFLASQHTSLPLCKAESPYPAIFFQAGWLFPRPHGNTKTVFSKNSTLGSVFKKLRFQWPFPSDTFERKPAVSATKKLRFQTKTDACGRDVNIHTLPAMYKPARGKENFRACSWWNGSFWSKFIAVLLVASPYLVTRNKRKHHAVARGPAKISINY